MNDVLLSTSKNFTYREALTGAGFEVRDLPMPLTEDSMRAIEGAAPCRYSFIEAVGGHSEVTGAFYRMLAGRGPVLCTAESMNDEMKRSLLRCGICDVVRGCGPARIPAILEAIGEEGMGDAGTFVVFDDDTAVSSVVRRIVTRFNYRTAFVDSLDELFDEALRPGARFILVNLGARNLDLRGLVRRFHDSTAVRKVPVLAYKDMREGLFVHELVGGLNRLTRYILGLDELYGLLVDLLFRKEIVPLVAYISRLTDLDVNLCYDEGTVSQAFFLCEKKLFDRADFLLDDRLSGMAHTVSGLESALAKVESLKWLKVEMDRRDINTVERGG